MAEEKELVQEVEIERKETWKDFLYNGDKGTVLGRTGLSWLKIGVFYIIFYLFLAGWFAGLLHAFYITLDHDRPTWYGDNSLIQNNPAIGMRPMPLFDSTMIRFSQGKPSSYRPYTDHLEAFMKTYDNVSNTVDCSGGPPANMSNACSIGLRDSMASLGCTKENGYGYLNGNPCVVLKMNKLFDFTPIGYENRTELDADLEEDERLGYISYADGNIGISCDGQNAVDKQNIQDITFHPTTGLSKNYFPYLNQVGYRSPVIVAKLADVSKRVTIQFNCRLWAKNIDNSDGKEKRGTIHFELYIG